MRADIEERTNAMKQRYIFSLCIIATISLGGLSSPTPSSFAAQEPEAKPHVSLPSDEALSLRQYEQQHGLSLSALQYDYYWIAGNTFKPRNSAVTVGYRGAGCLYRTSSAGVSIDDDALTANVQLPTDAVILGLRFYGYDTNAADSQLQLNLYDGAGDIQGLVASDITGAPGFASTYVGLSTPYTVTNSDGSLALAWYSYATDIDLSICGGRIFYVKPRATISNPTAANTSAELTSVADISSPLYNTYTYKFYTGANFQPRSTTSTYVYKSRGCISGTSGGLYTIDVDVPTAAEVLGVRMYYRYLVAATAGPTLYLTDYDAAGGFSDIQSIAVDDTTLGYHSRYIAMTTPYTVSQVAHALVLNVSLPNNTDAAFCGARIFYRYDEAVFPPIPVPRASAASVQPSVERQPEASTAAMPAAPAALDELQTVSAAQSVVTRYFYRFIAGSAFLPRAASNVSYRSVGCSYVSGGLSILNAALHLPTGAQLIGMRMFYYDDSTSDSTMYITDYNGSGDYNEFIIGSSSGTPGYGSVFVMPTASYNVDNYNHSLVNVWSGAGDTSGNTALCGMRAFYSLEFAYPLFLPTVIK